MEYALKTQLKFGWTVNMSICRVPDFGIYFELTPGEHKMVFELYDRCGNKTTEEIVLQRYVN